MKAIRLAGAIQALVDLTARLRGPGGCPWDAKQTDASIKSYLLEEAYETLDAIEKGDPEEVCMELGDLLFHIVFLARLAEERGEFDIIAVLEKITEKMTRRHPHVFSDIKVENADQVVDNWAKIKRKEQEDAGCGTAWWEAVPRNLPALMRAHRLGERFSRICDERQDLSRFFHHARICFEQVMSAAADDDKDRIGLMMGEFLFVLANLSRLLGTNSEQALRSANEAFISRSESDNNKKN